MLVTLVVVAIYVANLAELLSVNRESPSGAPGQGPTSHRRSFANHDFKRLMWFVQVSDLHLSMFQDGSRNADLKEFVEINVIGAIRPHVVLATGDLTDAKTSDGVGSKEMEEEWRSYARVLRETNVQNYTRWLDTRGNHDNFDVPSIDSESNYFRTYSAQGKRHSRSYAHRLAVDGEDYWFVAVDACLDPGPRRPFNFVGLLTKDDMDRLSEFERASRNATATVWFGHYPTSCVLSPSPGLRHLMRKGIAYLCGHLHTFGGLVRHMYTLQKSGYLELELADWKDNRMYRVGAVDHGLFSFADVRFRRWPVVLVTNPKDALFAVPQNEPVGRMAFSTHVRVLAFSPDAMEEVSFKVDDGEWKSLEHVRGPLFVAPWDPSSHARGLRTITVRAKDGAGREETVSQHFSLDGSSLHFGIMPRLLLMSNLLMIVQALFGVTVALAVAPLCIVRAVHHLQKVGRMRRRRWHGGPFQCVLRRLWLVSTLDRFYYPLVFMTLYVPFGPWLIGEVLEGRVGVIFSWGMYVKGAFLPEGMTYVFGIIHIWTFNLMVLLAVSHCADCRYQRLTTGRTPSVAGHAWCHLPMVAVVSLNAYAAYVTWLAYGTIAFFVGPLKTWSLVASVYVWYLASTLPNHAVLPVKAIFSPGTKRDDGDALLAMSPTLPGG